MTLSIGTAKLNSLLGRVQKGVGNNKILPVTEYLLIEVDGPEISITATNFVNFITVREKVENKETWYAIVKADTLIKLASKTTKPELKLTLKEDFLEIKGNGTYKLELFTEDFPVYQFNVEARAHEIETSILKRVFVVNRASIAAEMIMPCLTGYNMGETVVTTDGIKMCINKTPVLNGESILVTQELADLVASINAEKITIQKDSNKLLFTAENVTIFGTELDGINEYPDIMPILGIEHEGMAIVPKSTLLNAIDRLSLFTSAFDNNGIKMTFAEKELIITDLQNNSVERIELEQHKGPEVEVAVNIRFLKDLASVLLESSVRIDYGEGLPLKFVEGNVTQVLSVMSLDNDEDGIGEEEEI